ncbi:MAG TPA: preprotein translocase subunit SecY [Candidatus Thermoplasmatota archaeon]|nr:preprotein translocase subunit SecY [Candidatus Thermoplasmatota archaeon]
MADTPATTRSSLYALEPLIKRWPAVRKPEGHVSFKTKLLWTTGCLLLYFALSNIPLFGVAQTRLDLFQSFRAILAGQSGTLMHLGIGPIVTGSIVLQLFTGAKIIKLDLTKAEDKAIYQGAQKILVLLFIFIEAVPQVYGFLEPDARFVDAVGGGSARAIIIAQLALGAIVVFLMDELISKWGIGSGISLFIAAGVSQALFQGTLNWEPAVPALGDYDPQFNPPAGAIPMVIYVFSQRSLASLVHGGGFEQVFIGGQGFPNPILTLLGTIAIFMFVVFAEASRIELPLAHGKVRGARGRYPLRLIYASNIPVILMAALIANVNIFSLLLWQHPTFQQIPGIGHAWWVGTYQADSGSLQPIAGGAWYLNTFAGLTDWFLPIFDPARYGGYASGHEPWQILIKMGVYLTIFIGGSIMFAKFWVETTNMGPAAVAKQIEKSGMQIPGFRRDPRVLEKVLERYIPTLTVIGGATVGGLAAIADMIGTVGQASGTGLLLCVGIFMRMYEQVAKEQAMEMHPVLRGFFGAE